jgi:hypothetical protein
LKKGCHRRRRLRHQDSGEFRRPRGRPWPAGVQKLESAGPTLTAARPGEIVLLRPRCIFSYELRS